MRLSSWLYKAARGFGKAASRVGDVETIMTGDPKKIAKRAARKAVNKTVNQAARAVNKKFFK